MLSKAIYSSISILNIILSKAMYSLYSMYSGIPIHPGKREKNWNVHPEAVFVYGGIYIHPGKREKLLKLVLKVFGKGICHHTIVR